MAPKGLGAMMEPLESRVLLSAVPAATPNFVVYHPSGVSRPADTTSPNGLTPSMILQAYGFNHVQFASVAGDGTGQTIAIVDPYNAPDIVSDLQAFDAQFGLPAATLIRVGQSGSSKLPGTDPAGPGNSWALETSLDVEWAHAVAPGATLLLVEAKSDSSTDLFTAIDTARRYAGVSAVSMSWGISEFFSESSYDSHFTTPSGHAGVTFVAATGDSGAYLPNTQTLAMEYPAASPNVLAVGGTYLTTAPSGIYMSESGWGYGTSSGTYGGAGGGISQYAGQPSYQHGVVTQSSSFRTVPDVAFDADPRSGVPVYDSWDDAAAPWTQLGGTSMAAPIWAGIIAIANQGRASIGQAALDGPTQTLPDIYTLPSQDFHDITGGNNGYAAAPGYDLVTGRGTPIVNLLVPALAGTTPERVYGPGDFNQDGVVNDADYTVWADYYTRVPPPNYEIGSGPGGVYNDADYTLWADNFGQTTAAPQQAPMGLSAGSNLRAAARVTGNFAPAFGAFAGNDEDSTSQTVDDVLNTNSVTAARYSIRAGSRALTPLLVHAH